MNWRVRKALSRITKLVRSIRGMRLRLMNWNMTFKGVDDYYKARNEAAAKGVNILDLTSNFITRYLDDLWKREYPRQDRGFIHTCEWEELDVPISTLKCEKPRNMEKAQQYLEALRSGNADFPSSGLCQWHGHRRAASFLGISNGWIYNGQNLSKQAVGNASGGMILIVEALLIWSFKNSKRLPMAAPSSS